MLVPKGVHLSLLLLMALLAPRAWGQPTPAVETKTFVAYSMKAAQARVAAALKTGEDFRNKQPDLYYLGGITKPWAVVLDSKSTDWVLVGERDLKSSVLTLDDWVAALRARFIHAERDPGVTIDPRACEQCLKEGKQEGCSHYARQDVRLFGGIEDTRFGRICYEADWLMKQIGLGLDRLPVAGLSTYYDLLVEEARRAAGATTEVGSRFWFYPIVNRVNVLDEVVLLEKFQMGLFTEVLHAEVDGTPVVDVDRFEHYPSEAFSQSFSQNYDAAAQAREVLGTLRGLTRLAALAKGITQLSTIPPVDFFLTAYPEERVPTPRDADVLSVQNSEVGIRIYGGVELMALAMQFKEGDASALQRLVLATKPEEALTWMFEMQTCAGQLAGVTIPEGSADPAGIAQLWSQAKFLQRKRRYDSAIECLTRIIELDGRSAEAYSDRGLLYRVTGDVEKARTDYLRALEIDQHSVYPRLNLAMMLIREGNLEDARKHLQEVARAAQWIPSVHNDLGILFRIEGKLPESAVEYRKAIALDGKDAVPSYNLGLCLLLAGKVDEAVSAFETAVRLDPSGLPRARFHLAIGLFEQGRDQAALNEFDAFLRQHRVREPSETLTLTERDWGTILNSTLGGDDEMAARAQAYAAALRRKLGVAE